MFKRIAFICKKKIKNCNKAKVFSLTFDQFNVSYKVYSYINFFFKNNPSFFSNSVYIFLIFWHQYICLFVLYQVLLLLLYVFRILKMPAAASEMHMSSSENV